MTKTIPDEKVMIYMNITIKNTTETIELIEKEKDLNNWSHKKSALYWLKKFLKQGINFRHYMETDKTFNIQACKEWISMTTDALDDTNNDITKYLEYILNLTEHQPYIEHNLIFGEKDKKVVTQAKPKKVKVIKERKPPKVVYIGGVPIHLNALRK